MSRTLREAAQMALDALLIGYHRGTHDAIAALREALNAPEPEPVMEFKGRRLTPEGTRECWGMLLCKPEQDPARGALLYAAPPVAPAPAAPVPDGWVMVPREPTPEMIAAMPYPANTIPAVGVACYRAMITASPAAPAQPVPLTDEQIRSMWKSSEFRGNGGQADWFCEGIRAAEAHLGITGGKP